MKQIKAEILTDAGSYTVDVRTPEGGEFSSLMKAWEFVDDTIMNAMPFEGDQLLVIGSGASLKHIRVFYANDDVKQGGHDVEDDAQTPYGFFKITAKVNCLGTDIEVGIQAFNDAQLNRITYLPMDIGGRPVQDVVAAPILKDLVESWRRKEGDTPDQYVVLVPQLLSYGEAALYISDYIEETEKEKTIKDWTDAGVNTAKAWTEYRLEGKE